MATYQFPTPFTRDWKPAKNVALYCFSGSDAFLNNSVTVGGSITTNEKVRDWRGKIARGQNATGSYAGNEIALDYVPSYSNARKWCNHSLVLAWSYEECDGAVNALTGNLACPDAPVGTIDSTADAQALSGFARRMRTAQGSFRGSTVLAELGDTLRGIRNPAAGIRRLLDGYHRRSRRNIRKAIGRDPIGRSVRDLSKGHAAAAKRALSESWLEYQFGVLPLMADAADAYKAYSRISRRVPIVPVWNMATRSSDTVRTTKQASTLMLDIRHEIFTRTDYNVRYYGAVKLNMESVTSGTIEEAGFRTRDFLPALWEWIPYSFLVDYFTNIGDIIEAASIPRSDIAWMARTWRNTAIRDFTRSTVKPLTSSSYPTTGAIEILSYYPQQGTWRRKVFSRSVYLGSLVPNFRLEIPGFRNFRKYLNIAALASLRGMRR